MPSIATTDAQGLFTKALADIYKERIQATNFLRSWFPSVEKSTLEVSIEVQRGFEKTAVDVIRGTEGNRNEFGKSTEKIFIPPYYREYMDATHLQLYDRLYGATEISDALFSAFVNDVADKMQELQKKIERSYEVQCADIFETGVIKLKNSTNIDFKRKTESIVDKGVGKYWATATVDPFKDLANACKFLRETGKAAGAVFNALLGEEALCDLLANAKFEKRQDLVNMSLDSVNEPRMGENGASYHGTVTAGSYKVHLWAYPQVYDKAGVSTPYLNSKKVVVVPMKPNFTMAFAAVPQLITPNTAPRKGAYILGEYTDPRLVAHVMDIQSAGIPIPTAIDQIYTLQVVAS